MGLSKKTFYYSVSIAGLLVTLVILYFAFMLPSLYVAHMEQSNLDSAIEMQRGYIRDRSYRNLVVKNPVGAATIEIPLSGDTFYVAGKAFRVEVTLQDEEAKTLLATLRNSFLQMSTTGEVEFAESDLEEIMERLLQKADSFGDGLFTMRLETSKEMAGIEPGYGKMHVVSDSMYVYEGGMRDSENQYTTYIAFSQVPDALIFSFLPVMTPQMTELIPIVMESLPMIAAVALFLVLVASQIFARKIVNPVIRLSHYAEEIKNAGTNEVSPLTLTEKDEIGALGEALNEMYARLRQQYEKLQEKNKRQEVFLRASSHQLKTPVTAALLLVEGMIGEVGKYKDTKTYLPEVKKQLKSMQAIVEDILYLNHCAEHIQKEPIALRGLAEEIVSNYRVQAEEKHLSVTVAGEETSVIADRELLKKILDNLVSNAVMYAPVGERIEIQTMEAGVRIINYGGQIPEELLPHICEPFVSSNTKQKGRGLGLYIASYYAELLGLTLTIDNLPNGVESCLYTKKPHGIFTRTS